MQTKWRGKADPPRPETHSLIPTKGHMVEPLSKFPFPIGNTPRPMGVSRGIHVIELPAHTGTQQTLSKGWSSLLPLQYMDGLREMPRP